MGDLTSHAPGISRAVFELRFVEGFSVEETAEQLGVSAATVKRDWLFAKAFLLRRLQPS